MLDKKLRYFDLVFLSLCIILGYWLYVIPVVASFGQRVLFSDAAIAGLQAQKALEIGISGAYHLTWSPLFPWLMAFVNRYFGVALDDTGALLNAWSMVARIVPMYLVTRKIKNRIAATIAIILLLSAPMFLRGTAEPLAQTSQILIILTGLYISILTLSNNSLLLYLLTGIIWGISYMNRLEEFIYIVPFIFFAIIKIIYEKDSKKETLKLVSAILFFIIVIFPYLLFTKNTYGSWTMSAKSQFQLSNYGGFFSVYNDSEIGITTPAQVIFSGDPYYYKSQIWHPNLSEKLFVLGVHQNELLTAITKHFSLLRHNLGLLYYVGIIGFWVYLFKILLKDIKVFMLTFLAFLITYCSVSLLIQGFSFWTSQGGKFTIKYVGSLIAHNTFGRPALDVYFQFILLLAGLIIWLRIFASQKLKRYLLFIYTYRIELFMIAFTLTAISSLIFANPHPNYAIRLVPFFILYASYLLASIFDLLPMLCNSSRCRILFVVIVFVVTGLLSLMFFHELMADRTHKGAPQDYKIMWKTSGQMIYKDHGPGALIGLFHEGPAFYAHGKPFYLINDINYNLSKTLSYLEENMVEYIVATRDEAYFGTKTMRLLLNPSIEIKGWEVLYSNPIDQKLYFDEKTTNSMVVVWKRVM